MSDTEPPRRPGLWATSKTSERLLVLSMLLVAVAPVVRLVSEDGLVGRAFDVVWLIGAFGLVTATVYQVAVRRSRNQS